MSWSERAWEAFREVPRLQDKVNAVGAQLKERQGRIESLTIDVAELRMAVVLMMRVRGVVDWSRLPKDPEA